MDFFEVVCTRRSIRAFAAGPIGREKLQRILETANTAPSAGNLQAYEVFVVTRRECLGALVRAAGNQDCIAQAAAALVFCANPARSAPRYSQRGATLYCIQDATIACTFAQLAATALGLASVWVGAFDDGKVRQALGVGEDLWPVAILPIGYAAEEPAPKPRRSLESLVHTLE
ncbi:MAG TPA: nitroreductase family protein [Anaerolineae bacterium]|nr:nitroreductase family protein [Anaerolineae bacterium]